MQENKPMEGRVSLVSNVPVVLKGRHGKTALDADQIYIWDIAPSESAPQTTGERVTTRGAGGPGDNEMIIHIRAASDGGHWEPA